MIKKFALPFLALCLSFSLQAQTIFFDDFESYTGGIIPTCEVWSTWTGDPNDGTEILVVDDIAIGDKSGYVGPGSAQNILLGLGNQTTGEYTLRWEMYITSGSTGYFNIQGMTETNVGTDCQGAAANGNGIRNSGNFYFNRDGGAPGILENANGSEKGVYPEDTWFTISIHFNLSFPSFHITLDGVLYNEFPVLFQDDEILGAINFVSIDADNNFWLDNVLFVDGVLGVEDNFATNNFSISPNPVKDILNLRSVDAIDSIQVYDVLGKLVIQNPGAISSSIDMSTLKPGMYFAKVTINNTSKTFKIVK